MEKSNKKHGMFYALWNVLDKKDKWRFVFLMLLGVISAVAVLVPTQIISIIITKLSGDEVVFLGITLSDSISYAWIIFVGATIVFLMRLIRSTYELNIEKLLKKALANLRKTSFDWMITPRKNMDLKMTQGDALYRMNQTPDTMTNILCDLFETIIPNILSAILAFAYIIILDLWSMLIILGGIVLVIICVMMRTKLEKSITIRTEKSKSAISSMTSNTINNLAIVNLYKSMAYENKLFSEKVNAFYGEQKKQINLRQLYWALVRFIEVLTTFTVIFLCAKRIYAGTMLVGTIVVITNYVVRIFEPVQSIGYYSTQIIQASVSFNRFAELEPDEENILPINKSYDKEIETITLENVGAKNGTTFKVDGINLKFNRGEFVAISGESGCGKTTLIRILCGLCEKSTGKIIVNEKDKLTSAYVLSDRMSVSMQDAYIFNRDAELNILYPDGSSEKDYNPLIKKLSMEKIFNRKYDGSIEQNFENQLSGGEKKRIGISRAILRKADVYIFDEPTNDLDSKNAKYIIEEIKSLKENAIVIVVSHDDRVLSVADRIIRFEKKDDRLVEVVEIDARK